MEKKKSLANLGATVLLSVTLARTSAPMLPAQVYANETEPPADEQSGEYKTAKQEYAEKQAAYEEAKTNYDEACKTTEAEKAKLESLESAYEAADAEREALYGEFTTSKESSMKDISTKVEALDKQIQSQQEEIKASQAEKDKAQAELDAKNAELAELNSKIEKAEADLAAAKDNTAAIDSTKANIEELKNKQAAAEKRLEEVKSELGNGEARMESLKADKASAESELSQIQASKAEKESEISKKNSELSELKKSEEDQAAQIEAVEKELAEIEAEYSKLNAEYAEINSRYQAAEAEYNRLSELQKEKTNLETTIRNLESEKKTLLKELSEKSSEIEANGKTLDALYAEQTALENEIADLNTQKATLENEIANSDADLAKAIEELNSQKAEYETSLEEAQSLLKTVGIDYVNELAASYEKNVTSMTIEEYFNYAVENSTELKNAGLTTGTSLAKLKSKYMNAFTVDNLLNTMNIIDRSNEVRQKDDIAKERATEKGLSEVPILNVGVSGMKYAALEAASYGVAPSSPHLLFATSIEKVSNQDRTVSGGMAENIARGYKDPVRGWYDQEIEDYRIARNGGEPKGQIGHAANILNPDYTVTSVAYNGRESSQSLYNTMRTTTRADYSTRTITTDEFRNGLNSLKTEREATVAAITSNIEAINAKIVELQNSAQATVDAKKAKLDGVNKSIDEKTAAKDTVATKITEASAEKTKLENEKSDISKGIREKYKAISDNENKLKDYEGIDEQVAAAEKTRSEIAEELSEVSGKMDKAEHKSNNLGEHFDWLRDSYSDLQEEISTVENEISNLESELSAITTSESTAQKKLDGITTEINELEKKVNDLNAEQTALNNEIAQDSSKVAEEEKSLENLKATDRSVYQAEVDKLNSELDDVNTAINNLKDKVADLNTSIENNTAENQSAVESRKNLEENLKNLEVQTIDSQNLTGNLKDIADKYNAKIEEQKELATEIENQKEVVAQATANEEAAKEAMSSAYDAMKIAELLARESVRISGPTRYETSLSTADALKKSQGVEKFNTIIVATGKNFADSLAGSYLVSLRGNAPIISINPDPGSQQDKTINYINDNLAEGGEVIILGSDLAVPTTVDSRFNGRVSRIAGKTRYETNVMILEAAGLSSADELLVSTGINFADSLSASATGKPILLVDKKMSATQSDFIEKYFKDSNKKITVLGGTPAVSAEVYNDISKLNKSIRRIAGATRYDTSRLIAAEYFPNAKKAVIAYGMNFPDGLSGGSLAMQLGAPLLLASDNLDVAEQLSDYTFDHDIHEGYILGAANLVTDNAARIILDCLNIVDFK